MRLHKNTKKAGFVEALESRLMFYSVYVTLLGTDGDDHIVISFDAVTRDATVSGAANVADGSVFAASTYNNRLFLYIDAGAGDDRVEMGQEKPGEYEYFDATTATIMGGEGNDVLIGGMGSDTLDGGAGDDTLIGAPSDWGRDHDLVTFEGAKHGVIVDLGAGKVYDDGLGWSDVVVGISSAEGTPYADRIIGRDEYGRLGGGAGNDYLGAAKGSSMCNFSGGAGDDTLVGGAGGARFYPGSGNDHIIGGSAYDGVQLGDDATHGALVRLDLNVVEDDGTGGRDVLKNIHNIDVSSPYSDTIVGSDGNDFLSGDGGIDIIYGKGGNDVLTVTQGILLGGRGNDSLHSNSSLVLMKGGPGVDHMSLWGRKFSIERIVKQRGETVNDQRFEAEEGYVAPVNDLVFPPPPPPPPAPPKLVYDSKLRRWVLE